jgi:hypothetical protein
MPSPPAEKPAARQEQTGQSSTGDGAFFGQSMCELYTSLVSKKYTCQTVATRSYIVVPHP